jgi:hypothetical protein
VLTVIYIYIHVLLCGIGSVSDVKCTDSVDKLGVGMSRVRSGSIATRPWVGGPRNRGYISDRGKKSSPQLSGASGYWGLFPLR